MDNPLDLDNEADQELLQELLSELPPEASADGAPQAATAVQAAQFVPIERTQLTESNQNIDLLLDVSLRVAVELGRTTMVIRDILTLTQGSVVELDKLAGEAVDILVNDTLIARGEVVVVDEKFGVRITEIVSRARRVDSLGPA